MSKIFKGRSKYAAVYLCLLVGYLIYLNTFWFADLTDQYAGFGILFFAFIHLIYSALCLVAVGMLVLVLIFQKPYIILVGTLWYLGLTILHHLFADYFSIHTGFVFWSYLLAAYGFICYLIYLLNRPKNHSPSREP